MEFTEVLPVVIAISVAIFSIVIKSKTARQAKEGNELPHDDFDDDYNDEDDDYSDFDDEDNDGDVVFNESTREMPNEMSYKTTIDDTPPELREIKFGRTDKVEPGYVMSPSREYIPSVMVAPYTPKRVKKSVDADNIMDGFDLRKAVIYAEILQPKWKE